MPTIRERVWSATVAAATRAREHYRRTGLDHARCLRAEALVDRLAQHLGAPSVRSLSRGRTYRGGRSY